MSFHANHTLARSGAIAASAGARTLQRKCSCGTHGGSECARCQNDRLVQQGNRSGVHVSAAHLVQDVKRRPGVPLDPCSRSFMESGFGRDFGQVRVHTGAVANAAANAVNAQAYTVGTDIVVGEGAGVRRTREGTRLLAHELTHVLQQTAGARTVSPSAAEREAESNSLTITAGFPSQPVSAVTPGALQRQPKTKVSGERTGTKEGKDKFGFKADVTMPLTPDLTTKFKFGKVAFLDELKLSGSGNVTGEALGTMGAELEDMKLQVALTLARLELAKAKDKAEALKAGQLSLGATLSATDGAALSFDPFDAKRTLGASLMTRVSAATPSLLPSRRGELTLGSSITATGSATQQVGGAGEATPKVEGKAGAEASFKSAASSSLSPGGVLGKEASITAGLETGASLSASPGEKRGSLSGGGSLGLTGTSGGTERFIRIQVKGEVSVNQKAGNAATTTQSVFIGATTGFNF